MLRPLDPIRWTVPVVLARARSVLKRDRRNLTLRQALKVLALYGRRRTRVAVDRWKEARMRWMFKCVSASIAYIGRHTCLKRAGRSLERTLEWLSSPSVRVERIRRLLFGGIMTHRITTTHLAQPVTVEIGVLAWWKIVVVMYPYADQAHICFVNGNYQPIEPPTGAENHGVVLLGASLHGLPQAGFFIRKEQVSISDDDTATVLTTVTDTGMLPVVLRTLLNLGDARDDEPLTPAY